MIRIRKILIMAMALTHMACIGMAQGVLTKLPFDINIAVTKSTEIESKGICVARTKGADSATHCTRYSMSDGKFYAYIGPDGSVSKISFLAVGHHVLPDNWKALGLRLASSYRYRKIKTKGEANAKTIETRELENEGGNSQQEFLDIIKANGATDISRKPTYASDYQRGEMISFTIGKLHYDAEFIKWIKPVWCENCPTYTDYDNGLVSIEVVEAY